MFLKRGVTRLGDYFDGVIVSLPCGHEVSVFGQFGEDVHVICGGLVWNGRVGILDDNDDELDGCGLEYRVKLSVEVCLLVDKLK